MCSSTKSSQGRQTSPSLSASQSVAGLDAEAAEASLIRIQLFPIHRSTLMQVCRSHPLFHRLAPDEFISALQYYEIDEQKLIFERGKPARYFYVLQEGRVRVESLGQTCEIATPGSCFGEQGLAMMTDRLETAVTLSNVQFWRMPCDVYQSFLFKIRSQLSPLVMSSVHLFSLLCELPEEQLSAVARHLTPLKYVYGDKIVTQGEPGDCIYLLVSGQAAVTESESWKRNLFPGDFFGEQAILYNCPRTASVTASSEEVVCLSLHRRVLESHIGNRVFQMIFKNTLRIAVDRSQFLMGLKDEEKNRLIDSMQVTTFERGEIVIKEGTWKGYALWIVVCGMLRADSDIYGLFNCIGDDQILSTPDGCFERDVQADYHEVAIASIGRNEFEECLGICSSLPASRIPVSVLPFIPLFTGLPRSVICKLCASAQLLRFGPDVLVFSSSCSSDFLYIVKSGAVNVYKNDRLLRIYTANDHFGESNFLLGPGKWLKAVSEEFCECWAIDKQRFLEEYPQDGQSALRRLLERELQFTAIEDLTPVTNITSSLYALTTLCVSAHGHLYAMKSMSKAKVEESGLGPSVLMERDVLLRVNHPFMPRFIRSFQDAQYVYFLSEYVNGMSLFEVINERRALNETDALFYAGSVLLLLEYLHSHKIILRDLKPENVLIDYDGYVKVADFSSAKFCERTNTVIGTPQFMAPEVILGKTYGNSADLWSLGVFIFELLTGGLPFAQPEEDPFTICTQILTEKITMPSIIPPSSPAGDIIRRLLSKDPRDRGSAEELKTHPFFSDFSFDSLLEKKENPPYIPSKNDHSKAIAEARKTMKSWAHVVEEEVFTTSVEMPFRTGTSVDAEDWDSVF